MNPQKPGWQSTEFYLTLIPQVLALLVFFQLIPGTDSNMVGAWITQIVVGVFAAVALASYAYSRAVTKAAAIDASTYVDPKEIVLTESEPLKFSP